MIKEKSMNKNFKKTSIMLLLSSAFYSTTLIGGLGVVGVNLLAMPVMAQGLAEVSVPIALNRDAENSPSMFHLDNTNKIVVDFFNSKDLIKVKPQVFDNPLIEKITIIEVENRTRLIVETKQPVKFGSTKENQQVTLNFSNSDKYVNSNMLVADLKKMETPSVVAVAAPVPVENKRALTGMTEEEKAKIIAKVNAKVNGEGYGVKASNSSSNSGASTVAAPKAVVAPMPVASTETVQAASVAQVAGKVQLDKMNFKKEKGKVGKLTLDFSDSLNNPVITRTNNSLIIELKGVAISSEMQKRINAQNLGTATQVIDVSTQRGNGRIVLEQKDGWDFSVYQLDKKLTIEVKTLSEYDAYVKSQEGKDSYKGKPLSINFQNMDVRTILQVIADFSKLNILTSDLVTGAMTVRLQEVPWDQALDLILEAKNLQKVKQGNVIWIATRGEIAEKNKSQIELQNQVADLEPLKLEMFQLNHHKAKDVRDLLTEKTQGILSKRGTIGFDERNNMLFIQDVPSRIEEIRKLLKQIDIATRQVLIEAKIVIADDKFGRDLGAKFGLSGRNRSGNTSIGLGGTLENSGSNAAAIAANAITGVPNFVAPASIGAGAIGFTILNLASGAALGFELSALEKDNRGKVLSNPRLLTTDNKKALLEQGTEIPYVTPGSANSPPTITFKKAVLSLGVTPQISPNGRIIMNLQIRKDTIGELVNVQGGGQVPSIDTRNIDTQVTVNNGQTVVLGGVYEIANRKDAQKVPFLGDIPFLGNLFKHTNNTQQKAELLIFITPYVVEDEDLDAINNAETVEEIDIKRK